MVRIGNITFDCTANYSNADVEIIIPISHEITDEELLTLKNSTLLEEVEVNYGEETGTIATYALCGWKSMERVYGGTRIRWQTYRTTDIEPLKEQLKLAQQDNEDLTQALLELAEIVGGSNG